MTFTHSRDFLPGSALITLHYPEYEQWHMHEVYKILKVPSCSRMTLRGKCACVLIDATLLHLPGLL